MTSHREPMTFLILFPGRLLGLFKLHTGTQEFGGQCAEHGNCLSWWLPLPSAFPFSCVLGDGLDTLCFLPRIFCVEHSRTILCFLTHRFCFLSADG